MKKRGMSLFMTGAVLAGTLAGTTTTFAEQDLAGTKITFLNTKVEIQDYLEDLGAQFKEATGIEVEFYTNTEENHITEKYAAGEPYNIMMMDYPDVADYQEYLYDLTNEEWTKDGGSQYGLTLDEKIYGFPFVVEAMGLIYNADAIEGITGEPFNWEDYSNLESFKGLLATLAEGGLEYPVALNKDDWSLASHVFGQAYCAREDGSESASLAFVDKLKAGEADLANDADFNAVMDLIDTFLEYNINKDDPLSASYDLNNEYLKDGTVAFWPNGSWAVNVSELTDNVGIMPYPMDTENAEISKNLVSGATKMLTVDAEYASEEEQKAALEFLDWLVYSEEGQRFLVETCGLISAFSNNEVEADAALSASVASFVKEGKATFWYQAMPSDHNTEVGALLQKYIAGAVDRNGLAEEVAAYWNENN